METGASITAHGFYLRLGYTDVRESRTEFGLNYVLRKPLLRGVHVEPAEYSKRISNLDSKNR